MKLSELFRPPRAVLTLFISLMLVCAVALGWLGWQVLEQDRAMEAQRWQERIESAADRAVVAVERGFASSDAEVVVHSTGAAQMTPPGSLAYAPSQIQSGPVPPEVFAEAESLEFEKQDGNKAAEAYARLAESGNPQIRAEALVRLGRVLRRQKKLPQALNAYASLEKLGPVLVAGMPANLVARAARASTLREGGDRSSAKRETAALWTDLTNGQWHLTKATLETYLQESKASLPELLPPKDWNERLWLSRAAEWAFAQPAASGRAGLVIEGQTVSIVWERQGPVWRARLTGPSSWQALWARLESESGIVLRIVDAEGRVIRQSDSAQGRAASRAAAVTGLPWSLTATFAPNATAGPWTARRNLLTAGLAIFALVLVLGSFLIARAISRELAVSRLQSDFVSAVSHEFRTPLTSIRQLAEMLARGRVESEQHRQHAYDLILGQSDRLGRLVESLLDFGRMQAREYKFRTDKLEAAEWTRSVSEEFQKTVRSRGYAIDFTAPPGEAWILGDQEALGGALWNLLDNAVKYSPEQKQVQVAVTSANGNVEVAVRDRGSGIAPADLKRVFGRFYRGANAKEQGTKGTGIGLAMVKEIVEAHGGTVRVHSQPGQGSEFTMVLPCNES